MSPHELKRIVLGSVFRERLQGILAKRGVAPLEGALRIGYVRFKPGVGCVFGLGRERPGAEPGAPGLDDATLGYVKVFFTGDSVACFRKYRAREKAEGWVEWMPELDAVYFHFPMDRSVAGLPAVTDPKRLKHVLHESVPELSAGGERVRARKSRIAILKYKPERRCIVRADLATKHVGTGERATRIVVAQAYADDAGERVFRAMSHVDATGRVRELSIPRPLGLNTARRVLVQEWVEGEPLGLRLARGDAPEQCERAGRVLRALHEGPLPDLESRGPASDLAEALQVLEDLREAGRERLVDEGTANREIGRLRRDLLGAGPSVARCDAVLVHGDFYYHQLLIGPDGPTLIDWDDAHVGDPRVDVGNFLAHLHLVEIDGRMPDRAARELRDSFLRGYGSAAACTRADLAFFVAIHLAKLALVPFRNLEEDWLAGTRAILERTREILSGSEVSV